MLGHHGRVVAEVANEALGVARQGRSVALTAPHMAMVERLAREGALVLSLEEIDDPELERLYRGDGVRSADLAMVHRGDTECWYVAAWHDAPPYAERAADMHRLVGTLDVDVLSEMLREV